MAKGNGMEDAQEAINEIKHKIENTEYELAAYKLGYRRLRESIYHLVQTEKIMDAGTVRKALSHEDEIFENNYRKGQQAINELEGNYWRIRKNISPDAKTD